MIATIVPLLATLPVPADPLDRIVIEDEDGAPYAPDMYGGWRDADRDCQNTRQEVPNADARMADPGGGLGWYAGRDKACITAFGSMPDHQILVSRLRPAFAAIAHRLLSKSRAKIRAVFKNPRKPWCPLREGEI